MLLAHRGFNVELFEKQSEFGGRSGCFRKGAYTFDVGSTLLMMKFVLDEMFQITGRRSEDYLDFRLVDPMYRLDFEDRNVRFWAAPEKTKQEIAKVFPGNEDGIDRMLDRENKRLELLYAVLQGNYSSLWSCMTDWKVLRAANKFGLGKSMYDTMGDYFSAEELKIAFTFQSQYLGMSPWECPAGFSIVPYVEHAYGIYYTMGGINRIADALRKVAEEEGATLHANTPVKRLILEGRQARGVELEDGTKVEADEVILNADFGYFANELVPKGTLTKYSPDRLQKKRLSSSTFMLYLGLDTLYEDQPHHNFIFARDVRRNMADLYDTLRLDDDVSVYLCNPSVTDPSLAPEGHSALYVLVPVANLRADIDWSEKGPEYRNKIIQLIEERSCMSDLSSHIREEIVVTPDDWRAQLNVYEGAVFSLAHVISQLLVFRPHNQFEELDRCYIVGGGTNPGSGMPTIFESGRITSDLISKKYGIETETPQPLPKPSNRPAAP